VVRPVCLCWRLGPTVSLLFPLVLVHSVTLLVDRAPQDRVAEHQTAPDVMDCARWLSHGRRAHEDSASSEGAQQRDRRRQRGCAVGCAVSDLVLGLVVMETATAK
jgi:hypothetical protein